MTEFLIVFIVGIIAVIALRFLFYAFRIIIEILDIGCGIISIAFVGFIVLTLLGLIWIL